MKAELTKKQELLLHTTTRYALVQTAGRVPSRKFESARNEYARAILATENRLTHVPEPKESNDERQRRRRSRTPGSRGLCGWPDPGPDLRTVGVHPMKPIHQIRRDIRGSLSQLANEILDWDATGELRGCHLRNIAHRCVADLGASKAESLRFARSLVVTEALKQVAGYPRKWLKHACGFCCYCQQYEYDHRGTDKLCPYPGVKEEYL